MRKICLFIIFTFCISIYAFSIGISLGPIANEQYLIENDNQFSLGFYDFPLFLGGIYHKINFSDKIFNYLDLSFNIHKSKLSYYSTENNDMKNYLLYFHNDINIFPFKQNWVYIGAGMELIVVDRIFSEEIAQNIGYNFYITTDYFCYIDCGINVPIGKVEIGLKTLYRLLPFSTDKKIGNGEITFLIGLK
jgi:hypothetical protein